jgi:hypothetical protein
MARVIADFIKLDPTLIKRALRHTNRLLQEGQGTANADIGEWRQLLETYSAERIRDLLTSNSSRADRLRRSAPFFAVLTPDERDRLFERVESADEERVRFQGVGLTIPVTTRRSAGS